MSKRRPFCDHALARFEERIGFRPSLKEQRDALADILEGRALLLRVLGNGRQLYLAAIRGAECRLIFQQDTATIVTVLDPTSGLRAAQQLRIAPSCQLRPRFHRGKRLPGRVLWND